MTSILTGFPNLDTLIGGLQPADMLLLASPSSAKDGNIALSIVLNVAMNTGHRVGIFTLAMNKHHVVQRLLALSTGLDIYCVRTGMMTVDERNRLAVTARTLSHTKIWIDDSVDQTVLQLQQRTQAMIKAYNIAFLLIDNIHCLRLGSISRQRKDQIPEMAEMSDTLKRLVKVLNIPVLVLAPYAVLQTNNRRTYGTPAHNGPTFPSGETGHVLFLYRENVSQPDAHNDTYRMIPLIVNHHNGFVIDITLSSRS